MPIRKNLFFVVLSITLTLCMVAAAIAEPSNFQKAVSQRIDRELNGLDDTARADLKAILESVYVDIWNGTSGPHPTLAEPYLEFAATRSRAARSALKRGSRIDSLRKKTDVFLPDYKRGAQQIPATMTLDDFKSLYRTSVSEFHDLLDAEIQRRLESVESIEVSATAAQQLGDSLLPKEILAYTESLEEADPARDHLLSALLDSVIQSQSRKSRRQTDLRGDLLECNKLLLFFANNCPKRITASEVVRILDKLEVERPTAFQEIWDWRSNLDSIYLYAATNWISSTEKDQSFYHRATSVTSDSVRFVYTKPMDRPKIAKPESE